MSSAIIQEPSENTRSKKLRTPKMNDTRGFYLPKAGGASILFA